MTTHQWQLLREDHLRLRICLEVKEEGLALDPHDIVPLNIEIDSEIPGAVK